MLGGKTTRKEENFWPEKLNCRYSMIGEYCMKFKKTYTLPEHLCDARGLPRNQEERLMWIRQRVKRGYYESERIKKAVAEAFLDPPNQRRAGD